MLLLTETKTATTIGLRTIFKKSDATFLLLSIGWSLRTCVTLQMKTFSLEKSFFPTTSKMAAILWMSVGIIKRMAILILYFVPGFGLFNLLHHWKYEQIPFNVRLERNVSDNDFLLLRNIQSVRWSEIDRWNYENPSKPTPPDYSFYTGLTFGQYFGLFWLILALHTFSNVIVKLISCYRFRKEATLSEMVGHGLENCNLPMFWKDWDEGGGSIEEHRRRFSSVNKEMLSTMAVNFFFNGLMLLPLAYTGRKSLLSNDTHIISCRFQWEVFGRVMKFLSSQ